MKYIVATNEEGYKKRYLVRDSDGDEAALRGIPSGPPDLDVIDWHALKREINNRLADEGVFTYDDLVKHPQGFNLITSLVKQQVIAAFKDSQANQKTVMKRLSNGG